MEKRDASNKPTQNSRKQLRGAQPGNQNSRKHGFYSSFVTPAERRKLKKASELEGLKHEMDFLRVKLGTMMSNPDVTISQIAAAVGVITRVASVEHRISGVENDQDRLVERVEGALKYIGGAMGLYPPESDEDPDGGNGAPGGG